MTIRCSPGTATMGGLGGVTTAGDDRGRVIVDMVFLPGFRTLHGSTRSLPPDAGFRKSSRRAAMRKHVPWGPLGSGYVARLPGPNADGSSSTSRYRNAASPSQI